MRSLLPPYRRDRDDGIRVTSLGFSASLKILIETCTQFSIRSSLATLKILKLGVNGELAWW
jgi:hypothetical protein